MCDNSEGVMTVKVSGDNGEGFWGFCALECWAAKCMVKYGLNCIGL